MMEMRLFFEVGAANLICDIGEPAMDYRIAECEEECSRSQESGDSYRSSMADMKLHRMIVACARNSYMTELYNRVQNNCVTLNYLNLKGVAVVSQEAVDHHRMICDALRRLGRAALVSAITTHVRYVEEQIIRNIRENEQST